MPKKTKKEKLLALYHKKLSLLENKPASSPTDFAVKPVQPVEIHKQTIKINQATSEEKQPNKYFVSDLKKSFILIAVIIGLELSLYAAHLIK